MDEPGTNDDRGALPAWRRLLPSRPLAFLWPGSGPLDLRILGRTLLHAAVVGGLAGLLGAAFFAALELAQRLLLEGLTGYAPLRARGETFLGSDPGSGHHRLWLLALLPALGGLVSGLLTWFLAPEAAGGGGDAIIESYHRGGVVRRRVLPVKAVAAIATLATGGAGGREGPTMQIGGAIGALVGRWVPMSARERRVLMVAGIAAGIAAVFRTPLGAALLATEMLYRDDFESDALVPAVLASVIAYSIVISVFGETTLFGHPPRFPFVPAHLWLYGLLAMAVALASVAFLGTLRGVQAGAARSGVPAWARPAVGGLAMGLLGTAVVAFMLRQYGPEGARLGVFGGGYGAAQAAISGGEGLPSGWPLVALLLALFAAKLLASSLTIGSGGAAGDFAPSLVMGGLLGSAFGHAARMVLADPRIDPGAFALVGMGTFYGGIAHAPLSALVLVSELAGSYDLLVPMMLAVSLAFVALRRHTLYSAQVASKAEAPVQLEEAAAAAPAVRGLDALRARDVMTAPEVEPVRERARAADLLAIADRLAEQKVLLVADAAGALRGLVPVGNLHLLSRQELGWVVAADVMVPFAEVAPDDGLVAVSARLGAAGLPQLPVREAGRTVGLVGETELARAIGRAGAAATLG